MAIPDDFAPYVTSARRYRFRRERRAADEGDRGAELVFRALRFETHGTPLPTDLPARATLLAGDVYALEEVRGAGVEELRTYGLTVAQAEALINRLETDPELSQVLPTFQSPSPRAGQSYEQDDVTLFASAAVTAGAAGDSYELGDRGTLRLTLDVTALAASGELRVQVETRNSSADAWRPVGSFAPASDVGATDTTVPGLDRYARIFFGLSGASATFSVSGNAV